MIKAEKVFDEVFSARNFNSSPLTISGLDGDTYDYEMVVFGVGISDADVDFQLRFNADSSTNYRRYYMSGVGSSAAAQVNDSRDSQILVDMRRSAYPTLSKVMITGSSGSERHLEFSATGTTNSNSIIRHSSGYWKNTADNIISINLTSDLSGSSDAHIMLYRMPKAAGQSEWELMETKSWSTQNLNTTPVIFSTVAGDTDLQYKISVEVDTPSATSDIRLRFNSDNGNNYIHQELRNVNGTIGAGNTTSNNGAELLASKSTTAKSGSWIINAESGTDRLLSANASAQAASRDQTVAGIWWKNTADELDTIAIHSTVSTNQTGSAKLYRKRNPEGTGDTLPFEVIKTHEFSGDFSAGFDFTGLLGDSVTMYKLEIDGVGASSDIDLRLSINNDIGTNYVEQYLVAINSSVSAANVTPFPYFRAEAVRDSARYNIVFYIYPKSGSNRPILMKQSNSESMIWLKGLWWLNSVSEITSLKLLGSNTNPITGKLTLSRLV